MRTKEGLASVISKINNRIPESSNNNNYKIGKVYGVVLNENTPSKELFDKYGGWTSLGTVFYQNYNTSKTSEIEDINLEQCLRAKPLFPNQKIYPLIGELILIINLPSINTQEKDSSSQNYYVSIINIWNNIQHNAQSSSNYISLGKTFFEKNLIRPLQPYEGDILYEGRTGNSIRLGGTSKDINRPNPWSTTGGENDPITIISNGLNFNEKDLSPYIEDINRDKSSFYLTSTQTIPLKVDNIELNPISKPIRVDKYNDAQNILSSNRIVLSSKKDEILLFGKTNIGLYSKGIIDANSEDSIILRAPKIFIGLEKDGTIPTEPLVLGNEMIKLLSTLIKEIANFSSKLSTVKSTPEGSPISELNNAAKTLNTKLNKLLNTDSSTKQPYLSRLLSKNNFTSK